MGKKYKNLFQEIVSDKNLYLAYTKTAKGSRYTEANLRFQQNLGANLEYLKQNIISGSYIQGEPKHFVVFEPKKRLITAIPFVDRIAEHAINNIIEPIFDSVFLSQSYACRQEKGTHIAVKDVQSDLRRYYRESPDKEVYFLKTDFSKYFNNIKLDVVHNEFRRKISCEPTIELFSRMVPNEGIGLPTGKLMSQLSANIYGHIVDRMIHHDLGINNFYRYMDDIVVFSTDKNKLHDTKNSIQNYCKKNLNLGFSKWSIQKADRGVNFVGYRIWHNKKLLRKQFVVDAKRKIKRYETFNDDESLFKYLGSLKGHVKLANSHNFVESLGLISNINNQEELLT